MTVTPVLSPITIRFYRTGLKAWPPKGEHRWQQ
jgi:hypothetical protein